MKFLKFENPQEGPLSRQHFTRWRIVFWAYTFVWLGILVSINYLWTAFVIWKVLISIGLILLSPSVEDLFMSYEDYLLHYREKIAALKELKH
jgi:hypothetical protein